VHVCVWGQAHGHAVRRCMASQGEVLLWALLWAVCESAPRQLMRTLARPLRALLTDADEAQRENARRWLMTALRSPEFPGENRAGLVLFAVGAGDSGVKNFRKEWRLWMLCSMSIQARRMGRQYRWLQLLILQLLTD
jgi:hypothetical protein